MLQQMDQLWCLQTSNTMKPNHVGQLIFESDDLCDLVLQGLPVHEWTAVTVSPDLDINDLLSVVTDPGSISTWNHPVHEHLSMAEFDRQQQQRWHMPQHYQHMDIAQWVLDQCTTASELQRCGEELLLYQDRDLFDLLRYLKYLVDIMRENNIVWGVGRGSSVASYVLYKIGVHHIDSMFYDLDPREFLR